MKRIIDKFNVQVNSLSRKSDNFESLIFRRLVIPGIAIEILLAIIVCLPTEFELNLLTQPIGGPRGIAFQAGMLPCVIILFAYSCVAFLYSIILPCKYFNGSGSFLDATRRFLIFSVLSLLMLDLLVILGWIEFILWDYIYLLNIPVVAGLTAFVLIMTSVFLYWAVKIYKRRNIKFLSIKTMEGIALFIGVLILIVGGIFLITL